MTPKLSCEASCVSLHFALRVAEQVLVVALWLHQRTLLSVAGDGYPLLVVKLGAPYLRYAYLVRKVNQANYQKDPHYPRVVRAVNELLSAGHVVTPVEAFVRMQLLNAKDLEEWRFGRVPYLERIIHCNLEKAERILRLLRLHAEARGLKPSRTFYRRWGKGPKQELRFSKLGVPRLEELYATHFVDIKALPPKKPATQPPPDTDFAAEMDAMPTDDDDGHDIPF